MLRLLAALLLLTVRPVAGDEPLDARVLALVGSRLTVTLATGRTLIGEELAGKVLRLRGAAGAYHVRIDAVAPDAQVEEWRSLVYEVSYREAGDATWQPLCDPDPYGRPGAIPVPGRWDEAGRFVAGGPDAFSFACLAGARGKCVRLGYRPWATAPNGDDLAPYHEACVRMLRADYCGDGRPHTVDGTLIEVFDRAGVQRPEEPPYGAFEAVWGPGGALCVAHARRPEFPLGEILDHCPRLAETPLAACSAELLDTVPDALLGNRS